ncbi:MAG: NMD3-related protein [Sulfolobales archaeon]|nr:NMD3-related protein [Sulfolobales archaeon]MCX8208305.1 NMD3-related protein [Sulfolobales archaeon]MDW8010003.1 NMD3-related protein [Sulfolobales archaeon]
MRKFCAKCGRSESPGTPLVQGLCAECFVTTRKLVQLPDRVHVVRCRSCGAIRVRGGRFSRTSLSNYVRDLVEEYLTKGRITEGVDRVSVLEVETGESEAVVTLGGFIGSFFLSQTLKLGISTRNTTCPECLKHKARSFEAVIQLRPGNQRAIELVSKIASKLAERPGVVEIEESKNGVDLRISEKSIAVKIVVELQSSYIAKVTSTWEGSKYGRRKPRAVLSAKVYSIGRGDAVVIQGSRYEVVEANTRFIVLAEPGTGRVFSLALSDFWRQNPVFLEETQ